MCGIFAYLGYQCSSDHIYNEQMKAGFDRIRYRGPDDSQWLHPNDQLGLTWGFHRLAINGLSHSNDEPLRLNDIWLICNGEIYNSRELAECFQFLTQTQNDCEIILHLYQYYGPDHFQEVLVQLDGVFSFVLYDSHRQLVFVANDPIGIRPLYWSSIHMLSTSDLEKSLQLNLKTINTTKLTSPDSWPEDLEVAWASEPTALTWTGNPIYFFPPGTFMKIELTTIESVLLIPNKYLHQRWYHYNFQINFFQSEADILVGYRSLLTQAVRKRLLSDRPIATLLSGGLDSSLVTALTAQAFKELKYEYPLETFSIGLAGSPDLKWARQVANYLGTKHNEITVTEADFLAVIPEVIKAIQSYDITTVRASCGNWLLGRYIKANSQAVVILNGDVSEEIHASYFYSSQAPNPISYYHDNLELLKAVHRYDVLRSARSMENHSLECRTPFADQNLVRFVMSIDPRRKMFNPDITSGTSNADPLGHYDPQAHYDSSQPKNYHRMEKALIRKAFLGTGLLEDSVLLRKKTAFSDGVSEKTRSWYQIIQEHIDTLVSDEEFQTHQATFTPVPPTKEAYYYRKIYETILPNQGHLVSEYWMPRFSGETTDPSARVLAGYAE